MNVVFFRREHSRTHRRVHLRTSDIEDIIDFQSILTGPGNCSNDGHTFPSELMDRFHEQEWSQYIPGAQRQSNQCFIHFFCLSSFRIVIGIIWTVGARMMHRMQIENHSSVTFIIGSWFVRWCCQRCWTMRWRTIDAAASTPMTWFLTWTARMRRIGLRGKRSSVVCSWSFVFPERTICTLATTTAREANLTSAGPISEKGWKCHGSRAWLANRFSNRFGCSVASIDDGNDGGHGDITTSCDDTADLLFLGVI